MQKLCCRQRAAPSFPLGVLLSPQHNFREHIRAVGLNRFAVGGRVPRADLDPLAVRLIP
jgi:hypothetical protein